jgi:hypothetical protein
MTRENFSKPTLSEIQSWMSRVIQNSAPKSGDDLNREWICGDGKATVQERLSVYSSAYIIRLTEVLEEDFKALQKVLGEEAFGLLVVEYLKAYPSRYTNIGEVGRDLPRFLESYASTHTTQMMPFLPALASLEWNVCESFWAKDVAPFDFSKIESLSEDEWSQARFKLDSSVKLVQSDWPIFEIWKNSEENESEVSKFPEAVANEWLLVHRDFDGEVQVTSLDIVAFESLERLQQGLQLGELFDGSREIDEAQVQACFQEWIQNGIIREIILK